MAERSVPSLLARPVLLVAGLATAGVLLRSAEVQDLAAGAGHPAILWFVLLAAAACAVGIPRQVVAFAGGYSYGPWLGGALALLAQIAGCTADFAWARLIARGWVRARLRGRFGSRLARLDTLLCAHPFSATLTLRLLPVGNNLALNLLAGGFGIAFGAFLAGSAIGYLPQTIVFVLLGSGVHVDRGLRIAVGLLLLGVSLALGIWLWRRQASTARLTV